MLIRFVIAITISLMPAVALASLYEESPFGINGLKLAHSRQDPDVWENAAIKAKVMKDAGIYWDRLEIWWHVVEPEPGRFDWSYYDKVAGFYREQGINAMVILCYSSAWSGGRPPIDTQERKRFANYVYETVRRYKDTFKVWEIWNEPNIPTFWRDPDVKSYTLLLKEAYKAAKKADPQCTIQAACTSGPGNDFIMGIYENGGGGYFDAISIHPYSMAGGPVAQRLDRIYRVLREMIDSKDYQRRVPIWVTEIGWTTHRPGLEEAQASYLVQSYVISLANGVEKIFWFCLDDWGEKWGLVRSFRPFDPKPSYHAYKRMTSYLGSPGKCAAFEGYLRMPLGVAAYVFKKEDGSRVLVIWSTEHVEREAQLPCKGKLYAEDVLGRRVELRDRTLKVGTTPVIVSGEGLRRVAGISRAWNPYLEGKGRNLVNNGGLNIAFDDSPAWWNAGRFDRTAGEGKFGMTSEGRNGSRCVFIEGSGKCAAWDSTPIPVRPNRKYQLAGWIRTEQATGNNQIALFWYTGDMWHYIREDRSESIDGTNDWTRVCLITTAPENAVFVRVNLISEENSGKVLFDDIVLVEK